MTNCRCCGHATHETKKQKQKTIIYGGVQRMSWAVSQPVYIIQQWWRQLIINKLRSDGVQIYLLFMRWVYYP